jgi:pimeloyl-ACP methyl ester carboxylesterase
MKMQSKVSGEGSPLVLVPGGLTGWISWEGHAKILAEKHTVIRVQLLNVQYGIENSELPEGYSVLTESNALAETLDDLKITEPFDLVGWSYGAFTSLQYSLDHPDNIRTLTLIEPPALWILGSTGNIDEETQKIMEFFNTLKGDITEEMLEKFLLFAGFVRPGESARALPQWAGWVPFRRSLRNSSFVVSYKDDIKRVQNFRAPSLLVKGTGSSPWLHKVIDILGTTIPNARVVEYPGGHAPHIISMDKFMAELERFHSSQKNENSSGMIGRL